MGIVYWAEQLDVEGRVLRGVAVKVMQPDVDGDPTFARRFLREIRVASRLRNPHVVTVYDAGETDDGRPFFSMELIDGPTLHEVLQRQSPLPARRAIDIASQICAALIEAHTLSEPVVHRDLKPANVFIDRQQGREWVKVGDFGIAAVAGEHQTALTAAGVSPATPRYMAPEQWKGDPVDGRADLYALGVTLYEMVSGQSPFSSAGGVTPLMYRHLQEPPPPLPPRGASGAARSHRALAGKGARGPAGRCGDGRRDPGPHRPRRTGRAIRRRYSGAASQPHSQRSGADGRARSRVAVAALGVDCGECCRDARNRGRGAREDALPWNAAHRGASDCRIAAHHTRTVRRAGCSCVASSRCASDAGATSSRREFSHSDATRRADDARCGRERSGSRCVVGDRRAPGGGPTSIDAAG
jgi:serine/threonine protein kinase